MQINDAAYVWLAIYLSPSRRHIRTTAVRDFRRHANALAQRGMRVNGFADVHSICAHLYRQCNFADHVTGVRTDDAAAQNLAVAMR